METYLDKQLQDAKKEMEKAQAKHDALKEQVISLMRGEQGKKTLGQRLFNLKKTFEDLEGSTAEVLRCLRLPYYRLLTSCLEGVGRHA